MIKSLNNKKAYGEIINIASGVPITIKDVISSVCQLIGKGKPILGGIDYRENESMELYADINKAKRILDWAPNMISTIHLKESLNGTAKMINKPLISILMNCFNGERFLHESLKSIINQSYENWELIFGIISRLIIQFK